jgi:hypothetical protein
MHRRVAHRSVCFILIDTQGRMIPLQYVNPEELV